MSLLDRHLAFVQALRDAGLPVSLAEGLDAVAAIGSLGLSERETLRAAYAATLVKRQTHRPGFDQVFDLYWPALVGDGVRPGEQYSLTNGLDETDTEQPDRQGLPDDRLGDPLADPMDDLVGRDSPQALADFREALATAIALGDPDALALLAREGVQRFGLIRGRGPGEQRWSSYNVVNRVAPSELVEKALRGCSATRRGARTPPRAGWSRRRCAGSRSWSTPRCAAGPPRSGGPSTSPSTPCAPRSSRSTSAPPARPTWS